MGQKATELLINLIESKRPVTEFEQVVLQTEVMIRNSSPKKETNKPTKPAKEPAVSVKTQKRVS
jgi:hypothetical protein